MVSPHVDLGSGKIYGCKEGTWIWWHEKGHLVYNEIPSTSSLRAIQELILLVWMFSVTLSVINRWMVWISLPLIIIYLGIYVYEERWCNNYATSKITKV